MNRHDSTESSRTGDRERGAALILAFLAVLILVVVMGQVTVSSSVDQSIALNSLKEVQYEAAAVGALEIAKSLLLRDAKDEQAQTEGEDAEGEGGEEGFGSGGFGGTGGFGSAGGEQDQPNDTLLDLWADEGETSQQFGDGVEVRIRIIDEDRKLNLLTLVAADEDFRDQFQDRLVRLLDTFREDSKHDLSYGEAQDLADGIQRWLMGERPKDLPVPAQSTEPEQDDGKVYSESAFDDEGEIEVVYPLTMEELLHVDGMSEFLLHGFMEDERYVPGLEDVCTIYSNLVFDDELYREEDEEQEEDEFRSPFDEEEEEEGEEGASEEEPQTDESGNLVATETNHGRVNINTAPLVVLRALLRNEELSYSILDKVDEFRRNAWNDDIIARAQAFTGHFEDEDDEDAPRPDESDEEFGQEAQDFTFSSTEDVIDRVQDYFKARFDVSEEAKQDFANLIAVKSHVFTVILEMRRTDQQGGLARDDTEWVPPDRMYRAVVWRRSGDEGKAECVTIVPLHPFNGLLWPDNEWYRNDYPFGF